MQSRCSTSSPTLWSQQHLNQLQQQLTTWVQELGFQQMGISSIDVGEHKQHLSDWLAKGYHGEMSFMTDHGDMRSHPDQLQPGTLSIISVRMDYQPHEPEFHQALSDPNRAYISRYALGRDYHKVIRKRLTQLGKKIESEAAAFGYRAFVDSAPILERALAEQAGLGWIGKNTMLINRKAGSLFFLGELLTDIPFNTNTDISKNHCGRCRSCLDICPTQAFVEPYVLDARRCISYLTIELDGPIPEELRAPMGNRIFGCDDCQIGCPWNRFSQPTDETDFTPRHRLDKAGLLELFRWDEATFLEKTAGMPIRRTGYENWLRNIAVALGNAPTSIEIIDALKARRPMVSELVQQHIDWALDRHSGLHSGLHSDLNNRTS